VPAGLTAEMTATPPAVEPGSIGWGGVRPRVQGELAAEGFELADVVALAAFGVDPGVEEITAQVGEAGGGAGEQMPDDHKQGPADGHGGFLAAAAAGDAPVPLDACRTATPGCRHRAAPPRSPARSQTWPPCKCKANDGSGLPNPISRDARSRRCQPRGYARHWA
jgi:hypothetical protein